MQENKDPEGEQSLDGQIDSQNRRFSAFKRGNEFDQGDPAAQKSSMNVLKLSALQNIHGSQYEPSAIESNDNSMEEIKKHSASYRELFEGRQSNEKRKVSFKIQNNYNRTEAKIDEKDDSMEGIFRLAIQISQQRDEISNGVQDHRAKSKVSTIREADSNTMQETHMLAHTGQKILKNNSYSVNEGHYVGQKEEQYDGSVDDS